MLTPSVLSSVVPVRSELCLWALALMRFGCCKILVVRSPEPSPVQDDCTLSLVFVDLLDPMP